VQFFHANGRKSGVNGYFLPVTAKFRPLATKLFHFFKIMLNYSRMIFKSYRIWSSR